MYEAGNKIVYILSGMGYGSKVHVASMITLDYIHDYGCPDKNGNYYYSIVSCMNIVQRQAYRDSKLCSKDELLKIDPDLMTCKNCRKKLMKMKEEA